MIWVSMSEKDMLNSLDNVLGWAWQLDSWILLDTSKGHNLSSLRKHGITKNRSPGVGYPHSGIPEEMYLHFFSYLNFLDIFYFFL